MRTLDLDAQELPARVEHAVERHLAPLRAHDARLGVERAQRDLQREQLVCGHEVGLVEHEHVGELDLVDDQVRDAALVVLTGGEATLLERLEILGARRSEDRLSASLALTRLTSEALLTHLHTCLTGLYHRVAVPDTPCYLDVLLASQDLYGGFSPRVFSAYEETFPLSPGAPERVPLYQLYPLLVHVHLFGSGYVSGVERALDRLP